MRIDFRHGLYRAEIDSITRQPIVAIIDGSSLVTRVTNSPVVWTLAQFDKNYTLAEYKTRVIATLSDLNQAAETWVYVQINLTTGVHSFGVTPHLPTYGPEAPVGVDGQLWFNTVDKVTKRYESVSRTWRRTMCLVIGRWDGQTFHSIDFGSAVGLNATDCETGTIVRNAVNRGISDGLHGFLTTADHLFTDSDNTHDFKLESNITRATAVEPIPAFHVVTYTEFGQVRLANYEDTSDAVIALSTSSAAIGDPVELLLQGKAYKQGLWNWPEVNAALWVGESGKLVDEDPRDPQDSRPSKVPIARVIGKDTILFEQGMGGKGERGERGIQIPATDQYLGIVKLSVPADDYEQPVAVGINDPILWDHRHPASVIDVAPFEGSQYYSDAQSSIELLARTKLNLSGGNLTGAVSSDVGAATANELPTYRQVKDWVAQEIEPLATYEYVDGQLNERLEDRPTFTQMDEAIQSEVIVRPTFDQLDVILEDYYTELQAGELLATKVDKVVGKELSTNDLTDPLFNKLVSLESSHYRGLFTSLAKLIAGVANPVSGDYADVDTAGSPILRYIWDVTDSVWEKQQGDTPPLTPEQVKQLYEANDNTNAFTDGLLGKLQNIQALATKNQTDAFLLDRTNHTGRQAIGTIANLQQTLDALEVEVDKSVRSVDGRIGDVVLTDLYTPFIKHNINATTPPTATDSEEEGYSILSVWITNDGGIWICTSATFPAIWNSVAAVDLGSAAYLNIGTSPQNIPTNEILTSELGQAAWLDVGTNNDQVPTMLNVKTITENLDFIKVDKVEGMGLSANDFTIQLKEKLEALEGTHFRGTFISPTQLVQYVIDPVAGDYANVDGGIGSQVVQYIYDADDLLWVPQQAAVPPITASQVKQLYESNPNTNVYDDTAKAVVDGVTAKFDKADIAQATGTATDKVMSQKAVTDALGNKVDKELGYSLLSDTEIARLVTMETAATKNRADSENADKVHDHDIATTTKSGFMSVEQVEMLAELELASISISGPRVVYTDRDYVYTINGLDSFTDYSIQVSEGTAVLDGDKINLRTPSSDTSLILSLYAGSRRRDVVIGVSLSQFIEEPTPTPANFGDPLEGGFYSGMIWNRIALSTESKTLATGRVVFLVDQLGPLVYEGQMLEVRSISNPSNKFQGTVAVASSGSIGLDVASVQGSGTYSDWAVMSRFRNIIAPKAMGESVPIALKVENTAMPIATQTLTEGWESTNAMFNAGTAAEYPAAHWARALVINGHSDWYIPARDERELAWRNLKPATTDNYIGERYVSPINYQKDGAYPDVVGAQGVNLNSAPAGAAYTLTDPAHTDAIAFRAGGSEEFALGNNFWTSSEAIPLYAWSQLWGASAPGYQDGSSMATLLRVRAVRRSII